MNKSIPYVEIAVCYYIKEIVLNLRSNVSFFNKYRFLYKRKKIRRVRGCWNSKKDFFRLSSGFSCFVGCFSFPSSVLYALNLYYKWTKYFFMWNLNDTTVLLLIFISVLGWKKIIYVRFVYFMFNKYVWN